MADVEIYRYVEGTGEKVERAVARVRDVQEELQREADGYAYIATGVLAWHRDTGASYIEVEHGDIDYYVVLNDTRGAEAAGAIEKGHTTKSGEHIPGVAPLQTAFGLGGGGKRRARRRRKT